MINKIILEFEVHNGYYKFITENELLSNFIFTAEDLINEEKAKETQSKLEYIFYKERNKLKGE